MKMEKSCTCNWNEYREQGRLQEGGVAGCRFSLKFFFIIVVVYVLNTSPSPKGRRRRKYSVFAKLLCVFFSKRRTALAFSGPIYN